MNAVETTFIIPIKALIRFHIKYPKSSENELKGELKTLIRRCYSGIPQYEVELYFNQSRRISKVYLKPKRPYYNLADGWKEVYVKQCFNDLTKYYDELIFPSIIESIYGYNFGK